MEIVVYGNIIEGVFWILMSLFFWVPACRRGEKHRWFCVFGGAVLVIFGCSDFYEAHTGAWWKPWWLIVWNAACVGGIIFTILWYVKMHGSVKQTMEAFNRPVLGKKERENS